MIRSRFVSVCLALFTTLLVGAESAVRAEDEATEPLELGIEEQVEVKLVLVDFLVLDRQERTVPDVSIDDLVLLVNRKAVEIATLDTDCPAGAMPEPTSAAIENSMDAVETEEPRRVVLVFDYFHMTNVTEALEDVTGMLDGWAMEGTEHMLISLGQVVRVEAPLTPDMGDIRWALQRMRNDPDLYAGHYFRLNEFYFFDAVKAMFDLLERWPGRKSIILFSGPFGPDGFLHDPDYRELSALATATRTAVYPVDTGGLRTIGDPGARPLGGPGELRRLATETGGRMSADSNDIGLGYSRAFRDLGCTYTLGFYDSRERDDQRRLTIRLKRQGARVVYPDYYVVRSREQRRDSLFQTAAVAPQMFESDQLDAELVVLGPDSVSRWQTAVAVRVRPRTDELRDESQEWKVKATVRRTNGTVLQSFERPLPIPAAGDDPRPELELVQEVPIPPGRYIVSVVLKTPGFEDPRAVSIPAELQKLPEDKPFLIGPILGRLDEQPRGKKRRRDVPRFLPLQVAEVQRGSPLNALTQVCVTASYEPIEIRSVARRITTLSGEEVLRFEQESGRLRGNGKAQCHRMLDRVPTEKLEPGRYELLATSLTGDGVTSDGSVEFAVLDVASE